MTDPKPKVPRSSNADEDFYEPIVSFSECTGLIPAIPETDEELENMEELYEVPNGKKEEADS